MDDAELARLLSGRDVSVLDKEILFESVVRQIDAPRRFGRVGWIAAGLSAAAAVVVFSLLRSVPDEFAARGNVRPRSFELVCVETGRAGRCPAHGTIAFGMHVEGAETYFGAFARTADDRVIWFFPSLEGRSQRVNARDADSVLTQGVRLENTIAPGEYQVFGVFSAVALSRDDIKRRLGERMQGREGVEVVQRKLVVEAGR
jgi:hypothetical protein